MAHGVTSTGRLSAVTGPQGVAPPLAVLEAWGVADPHRLDGGQGVAFRAGDLVLKPTVERAQAVWLAEALEHLGPTSPRIAPSVRSRDGRWVVDGWTAFGWLEGRHRVGAWDEILEVSRRFHAVVEGVAWSPSLAASHRWAVADRVAWGELEADLPDAVRPLLARRATVDLRSQLVHGDLCGNVLFESTRPPAVIDVSPFWRPAGYADAIVVADAVAWEGAGDDLVEAHLRRHGEQLLLRAVLFRIAVDRRELEPYGRVIALLEA